MNSQKSGNTDAASAAERYRQLDLVPIPLIPGEKRPRPEAWQHGYFSSAEDILEHWERFPSDGIGLVCGQNAGYFALDVDAKHGGYESLADLVAKCGPLPRTVEAMTGGGGSHYVFAYAEGRVIKNRTGVMPGLDVRGGFRNDQGELEGAGQIAVWPTVHPSGIQYRWVNAPWDSEMSEAPGWLLDLIEGPASRAVLAGVDGRVPVGQRHEFLVREAARLRGLAYDPSVIARMLKALFEERCEADPPLPESEIEAIARWFEGKASTESRVSLAGVPTVPTPEFPLMALPPKTRSVVSKLAQAQDVSVDYVALQAIGVASGAIGTTATIKVASGWRSQPACIFAAIVGPPGAAKTEAGWQLKEPVYRRQRALDEQFATAMEDYLAGREKGKQRTADLKRRHDGEVKKAIQEGSPLPPPPDDLYTTSSGDEPVRQHAWTESSTVEGLADALFTSPRGVLVIPDELSKLWLSINKYSGGHGNDKQHYLEAWNAGRWKIKRADRKGDKQIDRAYLTIFGGIQPDLLPLLKGDVDDGTFERWLYCWPEIDRLADAEEGVDMAFLGSWDVVIDRLYELNGECIVQLDAEAQTERRRFYDGVKSEWSKERFRGFNGKAGQYWARLALILHLLKWAEQKTSDLLLVDVESARGASLLMAYFYAMAKKVHAEVVPDTSDTSDAVRECFHCGKIFSGKPPNAKYCSSNCRKRFSDTKSMHRTPS